MKRLALALATSMLASGCIYLTPPTGLRLGSHAGEFPDNGSTTGTAIAMSQYKAADFAVIFPNIWQVIPPSDLVSQRDGKTIKRISIGQIASNGDAEGLQVTNLLAPMDPDPAKNLTALGTTVQASLKSGLKQDYQVVGNDPTTMDGEPALRIEVKGTGLDQIDPTTGQVFAGKAQHFLATACWHKGRAYILVISTLETRWASLNQLFDGMTKEWRFQGGVAPTVCTATPKADAGATAAAGASAAASPSAGPSASPSPVPAASAVPAASGAANPAASATPAVVYVICNPDVGATVAAPVAGASASPAPSPTPTK